MAVVPGQRFAFPGFVYDTVKIAVATATPNPIQFFTVQQGQGTSPTVGSGGKQIQDTNITVPQTLPGVAPDMLVQSIRLSFLGTTTPNDINRLMANYILTFYVNNAIYLQAPLDQFPAGGGPFAMGQLSTAQLAMTTTTFGVINGFPAQTATFDVSQQPFGIAQGETFKVELNGTTFTTDAAGSTTLGQGLFMRVSLFGNLAAAANQRS